MITDTGGLFLEALAHEEKALNEAAIKKAEVETIYYIASRKYATARDTAISHFGDDPYVKTFEKKSALEKLAKVGGFELGRYRFIYMNIGAAIVYALYESSEPMTLPGICEVLRDGGYTNVSGRGVNAALINLKGVNRTDDGQYWYEPAGDDIPPWVQESGDWQFDMNS